MRNFTLELLKESETCPRIFHYFHLNPNDILFGPFYHSNTPMEMIEELTEQVLDTVFNIHIKAKIEEFNKKAEEFEREERSIKQPNIGLEAFIKISGGLEGGSEPPAFQRAERERTMRKEDVSQNADDSSFATSACQNNSKHLNVPTDGNFNFFLFT
ncbi:unnamed protein product [Ilex paraguariensis]|uniref:Uncharacterized protein n=1 Tax=Ilex paraguariensis TaxID=185542 RepID=A0ABC8QYM0_9AQUA